MSYNKQYILEEYSYIIKNKVGLCKQNYRILFEIILKIIHN